ncbi:M48 family metallopeptidase [Phaeovulum sp.]|uniref:M48 family metallopeptidase n=1 Tax=Phaeovulum sp. TaxID=2934796 RepID=UPI0039E298B4
MTQFVIPGTPEVEVVLRRSAGARRFSLRVSRIDGRVTLTLPRFAREAEARAFAHDKADWLREVLATMTSVRRVRLGMTLPFQGQDLLIEAGAVRAPRIEGASLIVPPDAERVGARVEAFVKLAARQQLQGATDRYAATLRRSYRRLTLRDTRSRWGSCTSDGSLMYNWRLILAPRGVLEYVAAHEVAHLVEMNHSAAFWAVVERLRPGHAPERAWLKRHGSALHAVRFRD